MTGILRASLSLDSAKAFTLASSSGSATTGCSAILGLPTSAAILFWRSSTPCISLWANASAFTRNSSVANFAPPSTIIMEPSLPATIRSISPSFCCLMEGLAISSPFIDPTLIPAMGPSKGTSDIPRAAEAPIIAAISGSFSRSTESTVATIWVSLKYPSGKSGRNGLSISLEPSTSFSLGLPSLLKNPPGILPAA